MGIISGRFFSQFDFFLFGTGLALAIVGVIGVYSAGLHGATSIGFTRQLTWVILGSFLCLLVFSLDYRFLVDHAFVLYGGSILVLIGILFFGTEINNSKSWISIGGIGFQPSEMVKVVTIITLARYLSAISDKYLRWHQFLVLAVITMVPVVLITLQGDLGTALMYFPIVLGLMLVAGLKMRFLVAVLLIALCVAPVSWLFLKDYQKQRILVTLDPSLDPQGIGYQTRQSQIAIGSGGITGKGLGNGMQSQMGFVPEVHTDFIFSLLAEETGLIGSIFILLLYLLLLFRLFKVAERARDRTGLLIVAGVMFLIFFHVVVNIGMTIGLLPPIGIPLPLLSYGGSSTVTTFMALGLALSVHYRRYIY
jgi:rod shape determining protein RodA